MPQPGRGVRSGKAWAYRGAALRIVLGEHSTVADLERDRVLVHEMRHLAFPSVPKRHHWIEEGPASCVESIARVQAGQLSQLYARMRDEPLAVDLDALWRDLGIERDGQGVRFIEIAREAVIRRAIMARVEG